VRSVVATLPDLAARVEDGDVVALGGKTLHRAPMALVRELVRSGVEDLTLVGLANGLDADLPCGTGTASALHYGYVGVEALGLAPNYRRAVEAGTVEPLEGTCYTVATSLRAARGGVDSLPVAGLAGSDLLGVNPHLSRESDPATGEPRTVVEAVAPDVALVHAVAATEAGDLRLGGADLTERLCASAADTVLATVERVEDRETFVARRAETGVPNHLVDGVAEVPYGAHPAALPGEYDYDAAAIERYRERSRAGEVDDYVATVVGGSEAGYRERAVAGRADGFAWDGPGAGAGRDPAPDREATVAETMAVCLLRRLERVDDAFQGFASPLPAAALRAAHERHGTTHLSASGAVDSRAPTPLSTESARLLEGSPAEWGSPETFDLAARGAVDVMFVGAAQFDRAGRMNGTVAGSWDDPKVKFGGGGGAGSLLPLVEHAWGWRTEHSPRTLPAEVDFVTAVGNLDYLVTPLCAFEPVDGELAVSALHPGVSEATVRERTGWDPTFANPAETPAPTAAELALLDRVDPHRVRRSGFAADAL
jgi:acyl CoA:acetate/3-ketoacid CoA transferase alpha subunit/acyl CoA:acetate/3-ketoacid CoA transferase beta subunit